MFLMVLSALAVTACHGSGQNVNCTEHLYSYTDAENEALVDLHAGNARGAFNNFAKGGQSRLQCVSSQNGRTQAMNEGYAAFDAAGKAAAAKHLRMDEDAARLMASAKQMAADVLKAEGIPPTMRWSMQKLANE